jgi:PAS domain S-box-containing protein
MAEGYAYCRMLFDGDEPVDFIYLAVNRAFAKLTGLHGVVGRRATRVIPGIRESDPELFRAYGRVARTGRPERFETFVHALDMWFSVSVYRPEPEHFVAIFDVITERKRAEHALENSVALLQATLESNADGILVVNHAGQIAQYNRKFAAMWGVPEEALEGSEDARVLSLAVDQVADPERFISKIRELYLHPEAVSFDIVELRDGRVFERYSQPHRVGGKVVGRVWDFRDVTDRMKADADVKLFRALIDRVKDGIHIVDPGSGRILDSNESACRELGYSMQELSGMTVFDIAPGLDRAMFEGVGRRIEATGSVTLESKRRRRDGSVFPVEVSLSLVEMGRKYMVAIVRDVTAKKSLEAQYLQSQKMEAFGQLAGGIAHDFNNILAAMLMELDLAWMEPGLSESSKKALAEIKLSARRAADLTRRMLLFSRRQAMEARTLDLNEVLDGVCKMLRRLLGEDIEFDLKRSAEPIWVEADPGMVEQIILNLSVNARDAMPQGGRLTVEVLKRESHAPPPGHGAPHGPYACIAVADTGCGMDEATRLRIFEPFFTTKPVGKGTGLGLATVYGIAVQHKGWVEVESSPGAGSTFRVYFPLREPSSLPGSKTRERAVAGGTERILVVEDEEALRIAMVVCLKRAGYRVNSARNGVEAMQTWDENQGAFDLLVTDIVMPGGINGLQLAEQLARARPGLKVITVTGYYPGPEPPQAGGGFARLSKPFAAEALLEKVRATLDGAPAPEGSEPAAAHPAAHAAPAVEAAAHAAVATHPAAAAAATSAAPAAAHAAL